ncbi:hypothetical protein K2Z84_07750 [Candidatus Binatia bacterium]|nr:hypothetical protein [Candidatus Binatia bacterium]
MEIVKLAGKVMPVLTRFRDGALGFRMMTAVRQLDDGDLFELLNADEQRVRLGGDHVLVCEDGSEVRVRDLQVGDRLHAGWTYLPGYTPPNAAEYAPGVRGRPWDRAVVVTAVRSVGRGAQYGFSVNETKRYFLSFGAMSRAQV